MEAKEGVAFRGKGEDPLGGNALKKKKEIWREEIGFI